MIYTFYSYKGGVGRSMAMANIAELFYRAGLKVLMVDWDLEAPGLEKFFDLDVEAVLDKPGVMDMILDYKDKMTQEIKARSEEDLPFLKPKDLAIEVYPNAPGKGKLYLLTAGRRSKNQFSNYANSVLSFDWKDFYDNWNGEIYFEWFRRRIDEMADVVLVDSRTGVTEMGGVCTYHFADVVVMFCATNKQNLDGTYEMARNLKNPEVLRRRNGRPIDLLIVPSRVEDRAEAQRLTKFHREFVDRFKDFVPENLKGGAEALWRLKIPQVPYYAFNEMVATRQSEEVQSEDLSNAFVNLADVMASLGGKGEILGRLSRERENIRFQKLRDFTVQIKNNETGATVGAGTVISVDGRILTTYRVAMAALGMDPFKAKDESLKVRFPQSAAGLKDLSATVLACTPESIPDGLIMLQLMDGSAPLKPDQLAAIGTANTSSGHSFRSYGFSISQGYASDSSRGIIQSENNSKGLSVLRMEPLMLISSEGATDMPGAAVLDIDLDIVVGIISSSHDGKADSADVLNTQILAFSPFNLPVYLNMGDAYARKSRYKDAIEAYNDAIDADPNQFMAWFGLGRTYFRIERIGESIDSFNRALEIKPDLAQAWLHLGYAYLKSNEYEDAVYAFERANGLQTRDQDKSYSWAGLGKAYRQQSRYDEAIDAYHRAVEADPKMASSWRDLGDIFFRIGQYESSIQAFEMAIEIEPYKRAEINPLLERAKRGRLEVGQEEMVRSLAEKDRSLDEMKRSLMEKERSINEKTRSLKEKDESLDGVTRSLEEKERSIDEKTRSIKEKDESLNEMTRSLKEKERSLDEMTRTLLDVKDRSLKEKTRSLAKMTFLNRILGSFSIALVIAIIVIINFYTTIEDQSALLNLSIYNNPLYWKGEGQAAFLGISQKSGAEPDYTAAIEAFNKSLEISSKSQIGWWTPQSVSETYWLMGNAYSRLGDKLYRENNFSESKKRYIIAINCYNHAIDISPLNYDAWLNKARLENKLNLSNDTESSGLNAVRINPNYGYEAWRLLKECDAYPSGIMELNSNISFTNFVSLYSKDPSHQFVQCVLPSNMSA